MKEDPDKSVELKEELRERIKNLSLPNDLPDTVSDAREFQKLLINTLGVLPENSIIMAASKD